MINKITYKEEPNLFEEITDFEIDRIQNHRRGSTFYLEYIIELKPEDKQYFEEVENFYQYIGTWKTNQIIWSDDYGSDEENKSRKERRSNIHLETSLKSHEIIYLK